MSEAAKSSAREISLGDDFGAVVVKVNGATIEVSSDGVAKVQSAQVNDAAKATHEIGDIEREGDHKGEIYGGIFPDGNPGWILEEPNRMTHYEACKLKGRALPTSVQGMYINTIKDKGALKDIFARHNDGSYNNGAFWLAEPRAGFRDVAWFQMIPDGAQYGLNRYGELPVLSVRR